MLWRNPTIASWNIYYKKGLYKPEEIVYNVVSLLLGI